MMQQKRWLNPLTIVLGLSACFFLLFLIVSVVLFHSSSSSSNSSGQTAKSLFGKGAVGVVELNGVIMDSKKFLERFERLQKNDEVKAIVVRINSPGGAVAPSQEIYEAVKKSEKPVLASMGSVAASGGYYVACGAKKVFANAGTITGSIGVIMQFANLEKLYEWAKIKRYSIKTGKFKDAGADYRDMSEEEKALLQGMVDDVLGQFKQAVVEGRKLPLEVVTPLADGRIFSGRQAQKLKLVDAIGTFDDALAEAGKMAGIKGKPKVIQAQSSNKMKWLDLLTNSDKDDEDSRSSFAPASKNSGMLGMLSHVVGEVSSQDRWLEPGVYWIWNGGAR